MPGGALGAFPTRGLKQHNKEGAGGSWKEGLELEPFLERRDRRRAVGWLPVCLWVETLLSLLRDCSPLSSLRFTWESFSTLHVTPRLPCNLTLWPFLLLCIHPFMKALTQQRVTEHPENPEARLSGSLSLDPNQLCLT